MRDRDTLLSPRGRAGRRGSVLFPRVSL
ncbi:hypothetical protein E2C01_073412 [Portunus trituberculatus]|uniref:Uncharacterized protein n=1 Tax=Portunus trituberculatus TaxID=210409 RepID=A0A5B7IAH4_PORTR|nr:hypothetical protein [Portunus trituberculatus]